MYKFDEIVKQPGGYLVRVFQGIDGFRGRYGIWPTKLRLGKTAYEGLTCHLTEFGFALLKSKIVIEVVKEDLDHISACDDVGRDLMYGWYEEKPDITTYHWLNVEDTTQFSSEECPETNIEKIKKVYRLLGIDGKTYESFVPGKFGGYKLKKIYGRLDCSSANTAIKKGGYTKHRVFFASEDDAILAGYRPCGKCMKDIHKIWKAGGQPGTSQYPWKCLPLRHKDRRVELRTGFTQPPSLNLTCSFSHPAFQCSSLQSMLLGAGRKCLMTIERPKYFDQLRSGQLPLTTVSQILKCLSSNMTVRGVPPEMLLSGSKLTSNLTSLPIYLVSGHKSWSGIVVCFPGKKADLQTANVGTPYIRSLLYPILELSRRAELDGCGKCIYIVGEYISEVLLRKFRLLKTLVPNLIVLTSNVLPLSDQANFVSQTKAGNEGCAKINENYIQKCLCGQMLSPKGLSVPTRSGHISVGYIKHELKTQDGTKEPEKLDILGYDKDDGSLIVFEIKGPQCQKVELENLYLQGIEHQTWVEENKRAIKLIKEGPKGRDIRYKKRVRLLLGFFGNVVPKLFHNLREQAETEDKHLKIDFVKLSVDWFQNLSLHPFPVSGTVSTLLVEKPPHWYLRGDYYFWRDMRDYLTTVQMPTTKEELVSIIEAAFFELTGCHITTDKDYFVERDAYGGMSSGFINPNVWRTQNVPLLVERWQQLK